MIFINIGIVLWSSFLSINAWARERTKKSKMRREQTRWDRFRFIHSYDMWSRACRIKQSKIVFINRFVHHHQHHQQHHHHRGKKYHLCSSIPNLFISLMLFSTFFHFIIFSLSSFLFRRVKRYDHSTKLVAFLFSSGQMCYSNSSESKPADDNRSTRRTFTVSEKLARTHRETQAHTHNFKRNLLHTKRRV